MTRRTHLSALPLEPRDNPASAYTAFGAAPGGLPIVEVARPDGTSLTRLLAYDENFRGGVRAAVGELDGNANSIEVVTAAGPGGGPHVRVFRVDLASGAVTPAADVFPFDASFTGGVRVAVGNVLGGGNTQQIIVGADDGGGPRVRVLRLDGGNLVPAGGPLGDFFAFESSFRGGVRVSSGEFDGNAADGEELVVAAGVGGGPRVRVLRSDGAELASYFAFRPDFLGGVNLTTDATGASDRLQTDGFNLDFSQRQTALNQAAVVTQTGSNATQTAVLTDGTAGPALPANFGNQANTLANGVQVGGTATNGVQVGGTVTNGVQVGGTVTNGVQVGGTAINNTGIGTTALGNTGIGNTAVNNGGLGGTTLGNTGFGNAGFNNAGFNNAGLGVAGLNNFGGVSAFNSSAFGNGLNTAAGLNAFGGAGGLNNGTLSAIGISPVGTTGSGFNTTAAVGNPAFSTGTIGVTQLGFGPFGDPGTVTAFPTLFSPTFLNGGVLGTAPIIR